MHCFVLRRCADLVCTVVLLDCYWVLGCRGRAVVRPTLIRAMASLRQVWVNLSWNLCYYFFEVVSNILGLCLDLVLL